jgi:hypothetical protein
MSRPMIRIHNVETDEIIDREMNDQEFAAWEQNIEIQNQEAIAEKQKADEKAAIAKRLGISADDLATLLG